MVEFTNFWCWPLSSLLTIYESTKSTYSNLIVLRENQKQNSYWAYSLIPATLEAEAGELQVQGQSGQSANQTLSPKKGSSVWDIAQF
jgi:hypothetical protein